MEEISPESERSVGAGVVRESPEKIPSMRDSVGDVVTVSVVYRDVSRVVVEALVFMMTTTSQTKNLQE